MQASSTGTLEIHDSVTNTGTGQIKTNAGTIDFHGAGSTTIVVNNTNASDGVLIDASGTVLVDVGTLELTGVGQVDVQGGLITGQVSTNVLDNDGNQITGFGQITNLTLQNETGGLIEALGGTLVLNTTHTILNESGGTLEASSTGTLEIHDSVTNTGTGQLKTNAGLIDFKGGSSTTIVVNNTSTTNGILIGANGTLNVDVGTLELTGAGAVTLSSVSALITGQSAANVLDNDGNQISGFGQITNLTLQNEAGGTIDANVSGQTLTLQTGNLIQNESLGVLEATLGGTLVIKDNVTNDGQLKALGGTIDVQAGGDHHQQHCDDRNRDQFRRVSCSSRSPTLELLGAGGVQIAGGTIQGTGANVLDNDGNTIAGFGLSRT